MKQKLHFENLDSLRFFAAIAVVLFHCSNWFKLNHSTTSQLIKKIISFNGLGGNYGVVFFFILSGFLITYLLFIENEKKGIHLLKFYLRRFFRIWPLYYFTLFIGFLVFPFVLFCLNSPYSESAHLSYYLCFATNFEHIYYSEPENGILGVQWSVAIEEQFYLFWPLLFLILKKIRLFIVFILIYLISDFFISYKKMNQLNTIIVYQTYAF